MHYRHADERDHGDLASGAVLRSAPGHPAFPVRLGVELLGRALEHLPAGRPVTVWDPCCGAGQLLTVLGLLRRRQLRGVIGSDVDAATLELARRNLALLTADGLAGREQELRGLAAAYGKASHSGAAEAAHRLGDLLAAGGGDLPHVVRRANALDPDQLATIAAEHAPEVVIADVPHGRQTGWTTHGERTAEADLVDGLARVLPSTSVIVVVARARRVPLPPGVRVLDRLRSGHRAAALVRAG